MGRQSIVNFTQAAQQKCLETPVWERKKGDFIERVQNAPDAAVASVFRRLNRHISHGEIVQVCNSMETSLRELWPAD